MANNLGKSSYLLTADATQFVSTIDTTQTKLKAFDGVAKSIKPTDLKITANTDALKGASDKINQIADLIKSVAKGDLKGGLGALSGLSGVNLSDPVGSLIGTLKGVPGPIGAVATSVEQLLPALKALGSAIYSAYEAGNKLAKEQTTIQKVFGGTITAAAGLQRAIAASGQTLDDLQSGFGHLQRMLGEAASGSQSARRQFESLGLSWRELANAPFDEALQTVSQHLLDVTSSADRSAQAFELFGRNGAVAALKAASALAKLPESRALAARFGTALSDTDVGTLKGADDAKKNFNNVAGAASQGILQRVAVAAAPIVGGVQTAATEALEYARPLLSFIRDGIDSIGRKIKAVIDFASSLYGIIKPGVDAVADLYTEIYGLISDVTDSSQIWSDILGNIATVAGSVLKPVFQAIGTAIKWVVERVKELRATLSGIGSSVLGFLGIRGQTVREGQSGSTDADAERAAAQRQITADVREHIRALEAQTASLGRGAGAQEIYALAQRGATAAQIEQLREAHRAADFAAQSRGLEDTDHLNAIQLRGLADTTAASVSAAQAQGELRLRQLGATEATIAQNNANIQLTESLTRALQVRQQAISQAEQWTNAARQQSFVTDALARGLTQSQAARQAQIADLQRQASLDTNGGWRNWLPALQVELLRAADAAATLAERFEAGRALTEQLRSPIEVYSDRLNDLTRDVVDGVISWETYGRAVAQAADQLERAGGIAADHGPQALSAGSAAAISAVNRANLSSQNADPAERLRRAIEAGNMIQQNQAANIDRLTRAVLAGVFQVGNV